MGMGERGCGVDRKVKRRRVGEGGVSVLFFFFKQKTAYEIGL